MPTTDYHGSFSSSPLTNLGRSIFTFKSTDSVDPTNDVELEAFQRHVAEQFTSLLSDRTVEEAEFLSLTWVRRLLDVFISCHVEFHKLLVNHDYCLNQPTMERLIAEYYERSVKALDVCNAIRDGIERIRQWERHLGIVLSALDHNDNHNCNTNQRSSLGEAQIRRAKKALIDLMIGMLDDDQKLSHRNRSFGRNKDKNNHHQNHQNNHMRSLSWSVSRSWSAAKQLHAMSHNLHPPRVSVGLSSAVCTMSYVLAVVMWALVAAVPCQDSRGFQTAQLVIPRGFVWARAVSGLHERVVEESRRREKRGNCGILKEVGKIEKWAREMNEMLEEERKDEVEIRRRVGEMRGVVEEMKEGLMPLESKVREVFHRIVRSRTQGMA